MAWLVGLGTKPASVVDAGFTLFGSRLVAGVTATPVAHDRRGDIIVEMSNWLCRRVLCASIAALALAGCPRPTIEAHEAAAALRENPHRIGTVSRQELASDVTDPDSTVGTVAKPAPVSSTTTVQVIGMVQTKICFHVEDSNLEARDDAEKTASYRQKMNGARYAALALRANGLTGTAPWPRPAPNAMIKVRESNPKDSVGAVVCVQAPVIEDDSRLIVLTMEWPSSQRLLAMWELTN